MKIIFLIISSYYFVFGGGLILPIQDNIPHNTQKALLGQKLFFDTILSKDKTISCASCHKPNNGWADNKATSKGVYNKDGKINSPTILNAVYNFKQFWNGSADDLKSQAKGPLHNNYEMDMDKDLIEERINNNKQYKEEFKKVYGVDFVSYDNIVDAIAQFEMTIITPNSKFDLYLQNKAQLTQEEQKGFTLFKTLGCITCHNGRNIGGNSFQKIGIVIPYDNCFKDKYEITKKDFDKCIYKVPTLRNIELTAPYFHDGSAKNLKEAIKKMSYHNLGFEIDDDEISSIEAFLKTLTGTIPMVTTNEK